MSPMGDRVIEFLLWAGLAIAACFSAVLMIAAVLAWPVAFVLAAYFIATAIGS